MERNCCLVDIGSCRSKALKLVEERAIPLTDAEISHVVDVGTAMAAFVTGQGEGHTYDPSSWQFCGGNFCNEGDLGSILAAVQAGDVNGVIFGKPFDWQSRTMMPNAIGVLPSLDLAVKVGPLRGLLATSVSLNQIRDPNLESYGIYANRASIYSLKSTKVGCMVAPLISGMVMKRCDWTTEMMKPLLLHELKVWIRSADSGLREMGQTFFDSTEDGNAILTERGVMIIDAETTTVHGKKGDGWVSGDISALILQNAQAANIDISDFGWKYFPAEKKIWYGSI